ncbi:MAG TPA: glycosyltransferase family 4 protein [Chloroflexota bacterium]|jgi:glycosyltransferase involved in cell wall biosynthesis|nr:glycosyltransferase family 4 protein [Chloroflexota bacterium]HZU04639.1 glycosyltransferase family 4 protein [Chloroflexota bacterium]
MKIGMLAPPWLPVPPTGYGGIELVVAQLADGLTARGHQVMLFAPGDSQTRAALFPLVPAHVGQDYPLRMKEALQFACSHYAYARAVLEGAQLIHDHIVLASDIDLDIPIVHTLHGPADGKNAAGVTAAEICRQVSASGRPEFYVAISHRQRELYGEAGINWAGTVHNAVDLDMAPFRAEKDDYLFFIGRANWEKGLDLAVRVAGRAGKRLVMAIKMTEEHEREYYRQHVEPWTSRIPVELLGEITPEEKFALYSRAQGTLFTSQWEEPFGLVMIESMACGTPVLALRRGAAPEVILDGETGFLCDDEDAMVAAVGQLGQIDPRRCREHVERHFSIERMAAGYEEAYARVLQLVGCR